MMGQQSRGQKQLFYSVSLDDHFPADHWKTPEFPLLRTQQKKVFTESCSVQWDRRPLGHSGLPDPSISRSGGRTRHDRCHPSN